MDSYLLFRNDHFTLSQSYDFPLPGYMFIEGLSESCAFAELNAAESRSLGAMIALAERVLEELIKPERIYVLRFGESDQHIHFHIIPRTTKLLNQYLSTQADAPPYNGALITAWIWAHAKNLGHSQAEIADYIASARKLCAAINC